MYEKVQSSFFVLWEGVAVMGKEFVLRAILGLGAVYLVNQFLELKGIPVAVGLNLCTLLVSGILGIPGVGLLYGILFYQIL